METLAFDFIDYQPMEFDGYTPILSMTPEMFTQTTQFDPFYDPMMNDYDHLFDTYQFDNFPWENHSDNMELNNQSVNDANSIVPYPTYEYDQYGGVVVTDIFGGKHHYSDMEEARSMSDAMSGNMVRTNTAYTQMQHANNVISHNYMVERNLALDNYHNAMDRGHYDEALRWERVVTDMENKIETHQMRFI